MELIGEIRCVYIDIMVRTKIDIINVRKGTYESKYTLLELLNEGGNAKVYRCLRSDTKEEYAIKILDTGKAGEKLSRFSNEIGVMQTYGGAANGVLPIIDADPENGWYVMPVAVPLDAYFTEKKSSIKDKIDAIVQLAKSLEILHERGITHRDIKPDNLFCYEGKYCFGDFGLCEYPEGEDVYTRTDKQLGAFNTIAPEMYKNPQGQDGKKADVYSLAKTMWILLTGDTKGFTGPFLFEDSIIAFSNFPHLKDERLAFIELVLQRTTDNDPKRRLSVGNFRKALETWTGHTNDSHYLQHYEWYLLMSHIEKDAYVGIRFIFDLQQIIDVLNMVGNGKILNHVLFPSGGGLDLISVEEAQEEGCIYLHMQMQTILVRPKKMVIATYIKSDWNFLLLETEEQEPITDNHDDYEEVVVEDAPAHYVSGKDARYGVYDYDTAEPLPEESRLLYRQLKGNFMIVPKQGYYNSITSTYDGRHGMMTGIELFQYVAELEKGKNPNLVCYERIIPDVDERSSAPRIFTKKYIDEVIVEINPTELSKKSIISFAFYIEEQDGCLNLMENRKLFLTKEGVFRSIEVGDEDVFRVFSRDEAIEVRDTIRRQFKAYYAENGYDFDKKDCFIGVTLRREGEVEPRKFTLEDIQELMRKADDREQNKLVIDEYGRANIIQRTSDAELYPVTQGTWGAGNVYVGKYSSLSDAERSYQYMLTGWLYYITQSSRIFVNDAREEVEELERNIDEITYPIHK